MKTPTHAMPIGGGYAYVCGPCVDAEPEAAAGVDCLPITDPSTIPAGAVCEVCERLILKPLIVKGYNDAPADAGERVSTFLGRFRTGPDGRAMFAASER